MRKGRLHFQRTAVVVLYACAALQFVRYYIVSTPRYLHMDAYLDGTERLPFQERVLPAILLRGIGSLTARMHLAAHSTGAWTADRSGMFLIALFSLVAAAVFTQLLYTRCTTHRSLPALVFPVFLFTMMWTFSIHTEANFAYPYDFPSVAFFSAGLWAIHARKYGWLVLIVFVGTFNRETTLFLIAIYVLDFSYLHASASGSKRFPWWRVLLLCALWSGIKAWLAHHFRSNDHSEQYVRLRENLGRLKPRLWPALLNVCGYGVPLVLIFRRLLPSARLRRWLWVLPLWFAAMLYAGVIVETRIFGELCPLVAVALVLVTEEQGSSAMRATDAAVLHRR